MFDPATNARILAGSTHTDVLTFDDYKSARDYLSGRYVKYSKKVGGAVDVWLGSEYMDSGHKLCVFADLPARAPSPSGDDCSVRVRFSYRLAGNAWCGE